MQRTEIEKYLKRVENLEKRLESDLAKAHILGITAENATQYAIVLGYRRAIEAILNGRYNINLELRGVPHDQ